MKVNEDNNIQKEEYRNIFMMLWQTSEFWFDETFFKNKQDI